MSKRLSLFASAAFALLPGTAWAHPGHEGDGGLLAGLAHPLTGADHLLAMLLVGLWAGVLAPNARAALLPPAAFLAAMIAGFMSGGGGSLAEPLILASLVLLGGAAALRVKASLAVASTAAAVFGFAHGMAHGIETPHGALPALFAGGFLLSTGLLHAAGLELARVLPLPALRLIGAGGAGFGLLLAAS